MKAQEFIHKKEPEFAKAVEHFRLELQTLRTGRAAASLVEHLQVEYYGVSTDLIQIAQITVPEPKVIAIQPYDKNALKDIEKAVRQSNLGINPVNDGNFVRLNIPPMTKERRQELVKVISGMEERARIAVRNIREEVWKEIQRMEKNGDITEDEKISGKEDLQKSVDKNNEEIKRLAATKQQEVETI